ncbi:hypothetical protein [Dactylosporangium sp. NPDC049140]|uniref:hypothetical protein n=1 Tax=Dactylosporangium sp. NPDC049140 TaxID=3155647 RepID=UPI0033FDE08B
MIVRGWFRGARRWWPAVAGAIALGAAAVVTLPWSAAAAETSIQDTARGTGTGQVQFSAGWHFCSGTCSKASDRSYVWSEVTGATATIRFTGRQISLFGVKEPFSYIATASIDGGVPADVDEYAATATATAVKVWVSPSLADGPHTLVLRMTNRKHPASAGGRSFTFDRADVLGGPATPAAPSPPAKAKAAPPPSLPAATKSAPFPRSGRASGLPWSDGGYFLHDPAQADAFAAWRGRPVDNIVAFPARETWPLLLDEWWADTVPASFRATWDDFIVAVPLWTDDGNAGTDADWRTLAAGIAAVDGDAYVRLGWEMNCCTSLATDAAAWRAQFTRAAGLLKAAAPGLRIVFNPNEGASEPNLVADASTLFVDGLVDVVAIDAYDWYPAYSTSDVHFTKRYGWNWWYDFAQSKGLPFALGEFSVATGDPGAGGDDPAYFTKVYHWLSAKQTARPGSIAFVSLFNEPDTYCQCNVYPTTPNPAAAARYRELVNSLTG